MQAIDLVVFDVDGVLVDVRRSYPAAIERTARHFLGDAGDTPWVTGAEIAALKAAGGFNSDWDVAAAVIWSRRAGVRDLVGLARRTGAAGGGLEALCALAAAVQEPDLQEIAATASEIYAGSARVEEMFGIEPRLVPAEEGLWQLEEPIVQPEEILLLPVPKAVYTGRTTGELAAALDRLHFSVFFPDNFRVTCDGPYRKPDGGGLVYLAQAAGAQSILMVGDNVDDLLAARGAQEIDPTRSYTFCGIGGGTLGERSAEIFAQLGAEAYAPTTGVLLEWLRAR